MPLTIYDIIYLLVSVIMILALIGVITSSIARGVDKICHKMDEVVEVLKERSKP